MTPPHMIEVKPADEFNQKLVENAHPPGWINPKPAGRYNLVVIGAGTAGLVAAAGAAILGARVALIERHLTGVSVTNAGARFFQEARRGFAHLEQASKIAAAAGRGTTGQLRIGILSSMGAGFLRELIETFPSGIPMSRSRLSRGRRRIIFHWFAGGALILRSSRTHMRRPIATSRNSGASACLSCFRTAMRSPIAKPSNGRRFATNISSSGSRTAVLPCANAW